MTNFADRLTKRIEECNNPTVMGLDPKLEYLPSAMLNEWLDEAKKHEEKSGERANMQMATGMAIFDYNRLLIDSVYDILQAGTAKAVEKTNETLARVRKSMRSNYFDDRAIVKEWKKVLS